MIENLRFLGGSSSNNRTQYNERKRFIEYYKSKNLQLLDTFYDRRLYGFINSKGQVVMPVASTERFGEDSGTTTGLNYVVSAFNRMRSTYRSNDSILLPAPIQDLVPKRSYDNFDNNYKAYELLFLDRTIDQIRQKLQNKPVSLLEFIEALEELIFTPGFNDIPMTKSGFALSSYSSAYSTGLYIDVVAEQDGSIDLTKPDFYEDERFECYVKLAHEHGFFVDANSPWRLVLNLEDRMVKRDILNGRPENEFDKFYHDVYTVNVGYDDYWALRTFCQKLYIEYNIAIENSFETMPRLESSNRWIEFLLLNRYRELSLMTQPSQRRNKEFTDVLQKAINTNAIYGLTSNLGALGYINGFFGQKVLEKIEEQKDPTNIRYSRQLQGNFLNRLESI